MPPRSDCNPSIVFLGYGSPKQKEELFQELQKLPTKHKQLKIREPFVFEVHFDDRDRDVIREHIGVQLWGNYAKSRLPIQKIPFFERILKKLGLEPITKYPDEKVKKAGNGAILVPIGLKALPEQAVNSEIFKGVAEEFGANYESPFEKTETILDKGVEDI